MRSLAKELLLGRLGAEKFAVALGVAWAAAAGAQQPDCCAPADATGAARTGCRYSCNHPFPKVPPDMPEPLGAHLNRFIQVETAKAEATQFVFFLNEWYMGGVELGPMGSRHLAAVAKALPQTQFKVVLAPCGNPAVDQARRSLLVQGLAQHGIANADGRVVIDFPEALDLAGEQADRVYYRWLYSDTNNLNRNQLGYGWGGIGGWGGMGGWGGLGGYGSGLWGQGFWGLGSGYGMGMPNRY
jgi:hypothetical protein